MGEQADAESPSPSPSSSSRRRDPILLWLAVPIVVMAVLWVTSSRGVGIFDPAPSDERAPMSAADAALVYEGVRAAYEGGSVPDPAADLERWTSPTRGVYVSLREQGRRRGHAWGHGRDTLGALRAAMQDAKKRANRAKDRVDTAEVCLTRNWRRYDYADEAQRRALLDETHRGVRGLSLEPVDADTPGDTWSPTFAVATNRSHARLLELFEERHGVKLVDEPERWVFETFECDAFLVRLRDKPGAAPDTQLLRGDTPIPPDAVTPDAVDALARRSGEWLRRSVHPDGRMTYMFYPSGPGEPDPNEKNNAIRQWMATIALGRYARHVGDHPLEAIVAQNIQYNLDRQFKRTTVDGTEVGYVRMFHKGKLGAAALAALAIAEHPGRDRWAEEERLLDATIAHLQREDGSFDTFIEPAGRTDQQNFYPGEALLYWAVRYAEDRDPERLERFMRSFAYYRRWHLEPENRNPAFVPWHTQAYVTVWRVTRDPELAAFIFEMNDWLLGMQQPAETEVYPDTIGRFYDPKRPQFGSPHASSTGVYLEGLIAAWSVARELGDETRSERYATAIKAGLRSAMQLQFVDGVDMYYVPIKSRPRVEGGLRTRVFDNRIRCDNVQHNLMAELEILRRFDDATW